jgi:hypothetical protein
MLTVISSSVVAPAANGPTWSGPLVCQACPSMVTWKVSVVLPVFVTCKV